MYTVLCHICVQQHVQNIHVHVQCIYMTTVPRYVLYYTSILYMYMYILPLYQCSIISSNSSFMCVPTCCIILRIIYMHAYHTLGVVTVLQFFCEM